MRSRVLAFLLLAAAAGPAPAAESGYVPKPVDLLAAPAASAQVVTKLPKKQVVGVVDRTGSWTKVRAGTASGWIRTIDLRLDVPVMAKRNILPAKSAKDSGIRGFSEEDLLGGSPSPQEMEKFKRMGIPPKDAVAFARTAGLKPRKQDYFEGGDVMSLDLPDDFFDE